MFSALTCGTEHSSKAVASTYIPTTVDENSYSTPFQLTPETIFLTLIFLVGVNSTVYFVFQILMFGAHLARVGPESWSNTGKLKN